MKRPFNCHCHAGYIASGRIWLPGSQLACHLPAAEGEGTDLSAGPDRPRQPWQWLLGALVGGLAVKAPSRASGDLIVCAQIRNVGSCVFFSQENVGSKDSVCKTGRARRRESPHWAHPSHPRPLRTQAPCQGPPPALLSRPGEDRLATTAGLCPGSQGPSGQEGRLGSHPPFQAGWAKAVRALPQFPGCSEAPKYMGSPALPGRRPSSLQPCPCGWPAVPLPPGSSAV